jgi:hypothetical protein
LIDNVLLRKGASEIAKFATLSDHRQDGADGDQLGDQIYQRVDVPELD